MCFMNVKNGPEIRNKISTKIGKLSEEERKSVEQEMLGELQRIRKILAKR